jgi:hypothetical protein
MEKEKKKRFKNDSDITATGNTRIDPIRTTKERLY